MLWDVFCQVVDNHGDLGVCWRLATQLVARGQRVRLWIDEPSALAWMAPANGPGRDAIDIHTWAEMTHARSSDEAHPLHLPIADVWVEAFGCDIPSEWIDSCAQSLQTHSRQWPIWINLEYLSAESYVERCHLLPSPVMCGPARGIVKHFFYPGFTEKTGGLLREHDLVLQQAQFDRASWLVQQHIPWQGERLVSLFCYEPTALTNCLSDLANDNTDTLLLVTHGRAAQAVTQALAQLQQSAAGWGKLKRHDLPALSQLEYDRLLWSCDVNFVRGEDSLVRAIWAGKPFVWHIYPQDDGAHADKLYAFLQRTHMPPAWQAYYHCWNSTETNHVPAQRLVCPLWDGTSATLEQKDWDFAQIRQRLWQQTDLCQQLLEFVHLRLEATGGFASIPLKTQ